MKIKLLIVMFVFFCVTTLSSDEGNIFFVCDNVRIVIKEWSGDNFKIGEDEYGYDIFLYPSKKSDYQITTTLYPYNSDKTSNEQLKSIITKQGQELLPSAVEKELSVEELNKNGKIKGYFYFLTDKNDVSNKEGEYAYLIQGIIRYNYLLGSFTILSNDKKVKTAFLSDIYDLVNDRLEIGETKNFEKIKLNPSEIKKYNLSHIKNYYSNHQALFYNNSNNYRHILPVISEKYTQSTDNNGEQGTVFYYYFDEKLDDGHKSFLTKLFFGQGKPGSKEYPELMLIKDNYLIIFSFPYQSKDGKEIYDIVKKKL